MTHPKPQRPDLYERVTARLVAEIESGVRPWIKPWQAVPAGGQVSRPVRANGTPYRGINVLLLWAEALDRGYDFPLWMTYKQAQTLGAQVRKGETGALVVFADRFIKTETTDKGEEVEREIPFLKGYTVFNVAQIDGLPDLYRPAPSPARPLLPLLDTAETFFRATGADIRHGGDRAYYAPALDRIQLPAPEAFRSAESYAATKAHELIHWTGHPARLARAFGQRFGDDAYAVEELVAEIGAAFVCADLGIAPEERSDHAAYLATWLKVLKADKRAIFSAAAHAQRAADHLHSLQPLATPEED